MGFSGISLWQLLIVLAIVLLVFGTKRMRNLGGDLGGAIKGFKNAIKDETTKSSDTNNNKQQADDSQHEATKQKTENK